MSASAVKSSMSGVGASPPAPAHSILPMNVMAQKVPATGNEPGSIKPLGGSGLSYVTLQPANQPLSLVQDHRPAAYQNPSYMSNSMEKEKEKEKEKEAETEKVVQNGVEPAKPIIELESPPPVAVSAPVPPPPAVSAAPPVVKQQVEGNRNNNQSPENPVQAKQEELKPVTEAATPNSEFPVATCPPVASKTEEKKATPVKNGSKPETTTPPTQATKVSPHKPEEQSQTRTAEVAAPKAKSSVQSSSQSTATSAKPTLESPPSAPAPKVEQKIVSTPRTVKRKSRELKDLKGGSGEGGSKPKRNRVQTQPYQSPLPEIALIVKTLTKAPPSKNADDKLIVFYKNEFLAVRNAEGSFYVCQAMQNIYKSSRRIRIRWLSQDKNNGEIYSPDFYDFTDFDCILTNLNLNKIDKNKFQLTKFELLRTENILKRAIDVEAGVSEKPRVTEEHPDGLDLSLYKDESQLKRRKRAAKEKQRLRKRSKRDSSEESSSEDSSSSDEEPAKKPSPKLSRVKKGSMNKALAIAKSVAKGPNRAKRALNRAAASNKPAAPIAANSVNSSSAEAAKRNVAETSKKIEPKKIIVKQQSTVASVTPRTTKPRGTAQPAQESSSSSSSSSGNTVRAKRASTGAATAAATTAPAAAAAAAAASAPQSTEDSSTRKKLRTTRA